jgi:hypothetical protein
MTRTPRPQRVLAAASLLLLIGVASLLVSAYLAFHAQQNWRSLSIFGDPRGLVLLASLGAVLGTLELYAGYRILGLHGNGRIIGLVLAGLTLVADVVAAVINIANEDLQLQGLMVTAIRIALVGFVGWALLTTKEHFN